MHVSQLQSLPTASPKTVCRVILQVLIAGRDAVFTQNTLRETGVSQNRAALTLLRWLGLLTASGGLTEEVFSHRDHPERFSELLREKLIQGCRQAGCEDPLVEKLGTAQLAENQVADLVRKMPWVQSRENRSAVSNTVSCIRTLHSILVHQCKREYLEEELKRWANRGRSRTSRRQNGGLPRSEPATQSARRGDDNDTLSTSGLSAHFNVIESSPPSLDAYSGMSLAIETVSFVVGFEDNTPIRGELTYPAHLDVDQLERLAVQFLEAVRAKQERHVG